MSIALKIENGGRILAESSGENRVHLVYMPKYRKGDCAVIETDHPGFYRVRLEDTMPEATVYLPGSRAVFPIPFGLDRAGYSPRSFTGERHLLTAAAAQAEDGIRNLALNPYDQAGAEGMYPHAATNVTYADSLRNKIFPDRGLFAPHCAIDGYTFNESHRLYPFQSFGVNRMADAWLSVEFGRPVDLEYAVFYLRCEFPHDTCWKSAQLLCRHADKTDVVHELIFEKTADPQRKELPEKNVVSVRLQQMMLPGEPGFAALTEMELYGTERRSQ